MAQKSVVPTAAGWSGTPRYEILGRLGEGGMGVVYEAFDRDRRQLVALKTLRALDPAALYLFKQEFRTLADVHHANLVHLHELEVTASGQVFFTMELLRGTDFRQFVSKAERRDRSKAPTAAPVRSDGPGARTTLPPPSPVDLDRLRAALPQLVEGIHALHSAGKLHRDIKPSNVLVTHEGRVVLLDFGVAIEVAGPGGEAPAGSGEVVGTARYMAPEQADDLPPSPACDWYSVGVMLFEALVGRPPFGGSVMEVLTLKSTVDAPAPSALVEGVPPELDALCLALLQRDPEKRPTGVQILRQLGVRNSSAPPAVSSAATDASAFIGRGAQLAALRSAFELVEAGGGTTVHLTGDAGMGKSTVVNCFLDDLARDGRALALRGRAYEREAVPYKAVDSVVDALSHHLLRLDEGGAALPLPEDTWALARLFPVLQRVPGVSRPPAGWNEDPQAVRRRAFVALRVLLTSLAELQPLVVFVDDAHWGDVDSAALLLDVMRPPLAPPMLLVMTYREREGESSPFLTELRRGWPEEASVTTVDVGALAVEDARLLALALLGADDGDDDEVAQRTARAVARESRGSPFLVEELVRSNRGTASATGTTLSVLTLDQMVSLRLDKLTQDARRVIEVVAVGGRPLAVATVAAASGVREINETIAFLGARRFARTGMREGREVVEASNGRIGETIVASLSSVALRDYHGELARVLEEAGGGDDTEAIAMHWLGAGDAGRAARFAASAAEDAANKLAFERAARLFRFTLENVPPSSPDVRRLQTRLAESLQLAGNHAESARMYLTAAEGAPADQRLVLLRAAGDELLNGGHIEEGTRILHRVLAAVGMKAPRSALAAVFWLVVYKLWLAVRGLKVKERDPADVSPENRLRVDALFTVTHGFAIVDVILSTCMQARHLIEALRVGDRAQVLRAVSAEAAYTASAGKPEGPRERALLALAQGLAERQGTVEGQAVFDLSWGVGLFQRGRWREAHTRLERAQAMVPYGHSGAGNARLFNLYTYTFLGEIRESARRTDRLLSEAEDRGDLYTIVNLRTSNQIRTFLSRNDPESARRGVREALTQWPQTGFFVQNWQAMIYEPDIDLYVGDAAAAYERLTRDLPALKKSLLLHSGFIRALTFYARGRVAVASATSAPDLREARLAEAREMVRLLRREPDAWIGALVAMLEAMIASATGDRETAIAALKRAEQLSEATDSLLFIAPLRYRRGQLLGNAEGQALVAQAVATMRGEDIRDPARWVNSYLPGAWHGPA